MALRTMNARQKHIVVCGNCGRGRQLCECKDGVDNIYKERREREKNAWEAKEKGWNFSPKVGGGGGAKGRGGKGGGKGGKPAKSRNRNLKGDSSEEEEATMEEAAEDLMAAVLKDAVVRETAVDLVAKVMTAAVEEVAEEAASELERESDDLTLDKLFDSIQSQIDELNVIYQNEGYNKGDGSEEGHSDIFDSLGETSRRSDNDNTNCERNPKDLAQEDSWALAAPPCSSCSNSNFSICSSGNGVKNGNNLERQFKSRPTVAKAPERRGNASHSNRNHFCASCCDDEIWGPTIPQSCCDHVQTNPYGCKEGQDYWQVYGRGGHDHGSGRYDIPNRDVDHVQQEQQGRGRYDIPNRDVGQSAISPKAKLQQMKSERMRRGKDKGQLKEKREGKEDAGAGAIAFASSSSIDQKHQFDEQLRAFQAEILDLRERKDEYDQMLRGCGKEAETSFARLKEGVDEVLDRLEIQLTEITKRVAEEVKEEREEVKEEREERKKCRDFDDAEEIEERFTEKKKSSRKSKEKDGVVRGEDNAPIMMTAWENPSGPNEGGGEGIIAGERGRRRGRGVGGEGIKAGESREESREERLSNQNCDKSKCEHHHRRREKGGEVGKATESCATCDLVVVGRTSKISAKSKETQNRDKKRRDSWDEYEIAMTSTPKKNNDENINLRRKSNVNDNRASSTRNAMTALNRRKIGVKDCHGTALGSISKEVTFSSSAPLSNDSTSTADAVPMAPPPSTTSSNFTILDSLEEDSLEDAWSGSDSWPCPWLGREKEAKGEELLAEE